MEDKAPICPIYGKVKEESLYPDMFDTFARQPRREYPSGEPGFFAMDIECPGYGGRP